MGLRQRLKDKLNSLGSDDSPDRKQLEAAAKQGAATTAAQAKRLAAGAVNNAPKADLSEVGRDRRTKSRMQQIGERAERAGQARAPVDAGLHLTSDPRQIESFAASGLHVDAGGTANPKAPEETMSGGANPGVGAGQMGMQADGLSLDYASTDPGVSDTEYGPGERPPDPMDVETNQQLNFGHSLLHSWVSGEPAAPDVDDEQTDWSAEQIEAEHERLVGVMEERGIEHHSPMGDVDGDGKAASGRHPHDFDDPFGIGGGG